MRVRIYLSTGKDKNKSPPVLYLEDRPGAAAPAHPKNLNWVYFATTDVDDPMLGREQPELREALSRGEAYLSELMPLGLSSPPGAQTAI